MNRLEALKILGNAEDRAIRALADADPMSDDFSTVLSNILAARDTYEHYFYGEERQSPSGDAEDTAKETKVIELKTPEPAAEEPAAEETEVPEAATEEPSMTLEQVRHEMKTLQMQGKDIASVIAALGYSKLSEVPAAKYDELLSKARGEV